MTAGLALALAAMVCFGLGDWTYRRAARAGVRPHHFLIGQACLFCPTVLAYAAATGHLTVGGPALWGNLAGLVLFLSFFLFARSSPSWSRWCSPSWCLTSRSGWRGRRA